MDVYKHQVGQLEKRIVVDTKEKEAELETIAIKLRQKTEVSYTTKLAELCYSASNH